MPIARHAQTRKLPHSSKRNPIRRLGVAGGGCFARARLDFGCLHIAAGVSMTYAALFRLLVVSRFELSPRGFVLEHARFPGKRVEERIYDVAGFDVAQVAAGRLSPTRFGSHGWRTPWQLRLLTRAGVARRLPIAIRRCRAPPLHRGPVERDARGASGADRVSGRADAAAGGVSGRRGGRVGGAVLEGGHQFAVGDRRRSRGLPRAITPLPSEPAPRLLRSTPCAPMPLLADVRSDWP